MKLTTHFGIMAGVLSGLLLTQVGCELDIPDVATELALPIQAAETSQQSGTLESGLVFESPVRIKAGGVFVSVEAPGYACPTLADIDGDGLKDLVVGQFNQGNMKFCRNISSTGQPPTFAAAEWLMTGGGRAVVPGVW